MRRLLLLTLLLPLALPAAAPAAETRCPGGSELAWARVQLFRDANCGGGQMVVKGDDPAPDRADFRRFANFDGRTYDVDNTRSSLIIAPGTCVRLYDLPGFGGDQSTNICATAGRLHWNLSRFDDRTSSMRVCTTDAPDACGPPGSPGAPPAGQPQPSAPGPAPTAPPRRPVGRGDTYVALGDSFSSGVGSRRYDLNRPCQRGTLAYPALVSRALGTRLRFRACGGAKVRDVLQHQVQSLTRGTRLVTISIGGNDAGFGDVVKACRRAWPRTCWGEIRRAEEFIARTLGGRLTDVYREIRRRSPQATVVVVGYPRIFREGDECNALARISPEEQRRMNMVADRLHTVVRARAQRHGFRYVDPRAAFDPHAVCTEREWINGVSNPIGESFHPNVDGYRAYAELVLAVARG